MWRGSEGDPRSQCSQGLGASVSFLSVNKSRSKLIYSESLFSADFLDGLIDRLPKELAHFNHRCVAYEPHSEGITLTFTSQDGKTITAEADGTFPPPPPPQILTPFLRMLICVISIW